VRLARRRGSRLLAGGGELGALRLDRRSERVDLGLGAGNLGVQVVDALCARRHREGRQRRRGRQRSGG
jgi:hypothetical protein